MSKIYHAFFSPMHQCHLGETNLVSYILTDSHEKVNVTAIYTDFEDAKRNYKWDDAVYLGTVFGNVISHNKRVHLYSRIARKSQECPSRGTNGMTTQKFHLNKYAEEHNHLVVSQECDILSDWNDSTLRHPGLEKIISRLQTDDMIYVCEVDRLSRNLSTAQMYLRQIHLQGASVFSINEKLSSHQNEFMQRIRFAAYDSARMSRQSKAVWARKKAEIDNSDEEYLPSDEESNSDEDSSSVDEVVDKLANSDNMVMDSVGNGWTGTSSSELVEDQTLFPIFSHFMRIWGH